MKKITLCLLLAFYLLSQTALNFSYGNQVYSMMDAHPSDFPRNYRTIRDASILQKEKANFNSQGLDGLKLSGSGQFSAQSFRNILENLEIESKNVTVIDLREESHGLVNGLPVSWKDAINYYMNVGKTEQEIRLDEKERLILEAEKGQVVFYQDSKEMIVDEDKAVKLDVQEVKTEEELVIENNCAYIRWSVTDHHAPNPQIVEQFLKFVVNLPSNQWVHVHCRGGKGRTTTFMVMFDIVRNAKEVSLKDILNRQIMMGGVDLTQISHINPERERISKERLKFIQNFYSYCQEHPDFDVNWSEWLEMANLHQ